MSTEGAEKIVVLGAGNALSISGRAEIRLIRIRHGAAILGIREQGLEIVRNVPVDDATAEQVVLRP